MKLLFTFRYLNSKGISELKACLDYFEYPARGYENLNFCLPNLEASVTSDALKIEPNTVVMHYRV